MFSLQSILLISWGISYPVSAILSQAFAADDEAWSRERSDVTAERGYGLEEGRPRLWLCSGDICEGGGNIWGFGFTRH